MKLWLLAAALSPIYAAPVEHPLPPALPAVAEAPAPALPPAAAAGSLPEAAGVPSASPETAAPRGWLTLEPEQWEREVGSRWARAFAAAGLPDDGVVVEVAPGPVSKVGRGLQEAGFKGSLYVVDPSPEALRAVTKAYRAMLPGARIVPVQATMQEAADNLPRGVDAVVANHPMDDMLLAKFLTPSQLKEVFSKDYGHEFFEAVRKHWEAAERAPAALARNREDLVDDWKRFLARVAPRLLGLAQYPSGYFKKEGFAIPDEHAFRIVSRLRAELGWNAVDPGDGHLIDRTRWALLQDPSPAATRRWPKTLFVSAPAYALDAARVRVVGFQPELAGGDQERFKTTYGVTLHPEEAADPRPTVLTYVDKQADPMNLGLNGNRGAGRSAYLKEKANVKGIGRTPLAVSSSAAYRTGKVDLPNALWEMLAANIVHRNLETGAAPVAGVLDQGVTFTPPFSDKPLRAASVVRLDEDGALDRPAHLFEEGRPLSRRALLRIADAFGRQEGEKFIGRILHGAWSVGNISTRGHMIDFDTVAAVRTRHPQYSLTGKYVTNYFGLESLGQAKILEALAADPRINVGGASGAELVERMDRARKRQIARRFKDLMGLPGARAASPANPRYAELVREFDGLSRKFYPDLTALGAWAGAEKSPAVFDFSRFMRLYPLLRLSGAYTPEKAFALLYRPPRDGALRLSPSDAVSDAARDYLLSRHGVQSEAALASLRDRARRFVERYDAFFRAAVRSPRGALAVRVAARAYRVNEDLKYLDYRDGNRLINHLYERYDRGELSDGRLRDTMARLIKASDRRVNPSAREWTSDATVFREGVRSVRLLHNGKFRDVLELFDGGGTLFGPARDFSELLEERPIEFRQGDRAVVLTPL